MFEKEAEEYADKDFGMYEPTDHERYAKETDWRNGAEFGYNKALEEVKHDLMMKLKDEGIVKVLKDSIFCNKKLSSKEQKELCEWIECAMGFGENLDECAEKLTEAKELLKRWVDDKVYTDLRADTEQFLKEADE